MPCPVSAIDSPSTSPIAQEAPQETLSLPLLILRHYGETIRFRRKDREDLYMHYDIVFLEAADQGDASRKKQGWISFAFSIAAGAASIFGGAGFALGAAFDLGDSAKNMLTKIPEGISLLLNGVGNGYSTVVSGDTHSKDAHQSHIERKGQERSKRADDLGRSAEQAASLLSEFLRSQEQRLAR